MRRLLCTALLLLATVHLFGTGSAQTTAAASSRNASSKFDRDACVLKLREQTKCYSRLQVDFGRHLRKCAEQVCPFGKKKRRRRRRKREGGFEAGVELLRRKYDQLQRCAKAAVGEALVRCDLLTYHELGRSFYDYIPCGQVRQCFQERADMKDFQLANEECHKILPSMCKQSLHVTKCLCVQAAKAQIDAQCAGFQLAKVDCFKLDVDDA